MAETSPFEAVCQALSRDVSKEFPCTAIEHIDITCDGCETEPIVGRR